MVTMRCHLEQKTLCHFLWHMVDQDLNHNTPTFLDKQVPMCQLIDQSIERKLVDNCFDNSFNNLRHISMKKCETFTDPTCLNDE